MNNFWARLITGLGLLLVFGGTFVYLPPRAFSFLLGLILLEVLVLEWPKIAGKNIWFWLFSVVYLILPISLLIILNEQGYTGVLGLLFIVVPASDIGGYLVGSLFGNHKMCPNISPKKSWEGLLGSYLAVLTVLFIAGYLLTHGYLKDPHMLLERLFINPDISPARNSVGVDQNLFEFISPGISSVLHSKMYREIFTLIFAFIITILATAGDLFESWLKRQSGLKDSGSLLPGHGGFLDRFDSFVFTTYFFYLCRSLISNWFF
jgi:phosphatidate cytidylyltransferase